MIENSNSQLLHKLQKPEQQHKDLVECSEDLESAPGETQIQSKQEKEHFESEGEGLQQQVSKEWKEEGLGLFHSSCFSLCILIGRIKCLTQTCCLTRDSSKIWLVWKRWGKKARIPAVSK